jgi:hypothetical protein
MTLAHTVLAMVGAKIARVRCNTCNGDHAYRTDPGSRPAAAPRERAERVVVSFDSQLEGKDVANAKPYSPKETYRVEDVMRHPNFGLGIVTAVRGDKVEVSFKMTQKTLVHGRGDSSGARPTYHPPAAATDAPADKPLPKGD